MKGQSLIEAVVGVGITILILTGLMVATTSSLWFGWQSKYRTQAIGYAREGMEYVRGVRDRSWTEFFEKTGRYCLSMTFVWTPLTDPEERCPIEGNGFGREVVFTKDVTSYSGSEVSISVQWLEGLWVQSTNLISYFSNWKN